MLITSLRGEQARRLVRAAKLLAGLGSPATLGALCGCSPADAERVVRTLLARLSRSQPPLPDYRWTEVWQQLRDLREAAFPDLPAADVLADLCTALLRSGQWRLAQKYLAGTASTPLDAGAAETLVLDCAKELFYSAASLQSAEVTQALACLGVLPSSVGCAAERSFIQGVLRLQDWGVQLPPLQYTQVGDRMELLGMALEAQPDAYADSARLAMLADQLGIAERHAEVRMRQAAAALAAQDHAAAAEHAVALAKEGCAPAWEVLQCPEGSGAWQDDEGSLRTLAAFVVAHCPPDQVQDRLDVWKRLRGAPEPVASLGDLHALLLQALRGPGQPGASESAPVLPDAGDAALALACLLALQAGGSAVDEEELLRGLSFAASRSVLLLRMFASGLQALSPSQAADADVESHAERVQQRLACDPWQLHAACAELDPGMLSPDAAAAQEACHRYHRQLTAAGEERALRSLLPGSAVSAFMGPATANGERLQQQLAALVKVAEAAGRDGPAGQKRLQQALDLGACHDVDGWPLRMAFAEALLLHKALDADDKACIQALLPKLLERPEELVQALATRVWAQLAPTSHAQLAGVLGVLEECLSGMGADTTQAQHHLQAARDWVQRAARVGPSLDAMLFVAPLLSAAIRSAAPSAAEEVLLEATCSAEQAACMQNKHATGDEDGPAHRPAHAAGTANGSASAPFLSAASHGAGREHAEKGRPHAKRQLFAINDEAGREAAAQLLAPRWNACGLAQILEHATATNAAKLAALMRCLPDAEALISADGGRSGEESSSPEPRVGHGAVLLAATSSALSEAASSGAPGPGNSGNGGLQKADAESDLQRQYSACRKLMRQLEPLQLAALLRYLLADGPHPFTRVLPGACGEARPAAALQPGGPLRAQAVQDGVALIQAALAKTAKTAEAASLSGGYRAEKDLQSLQEQLQGEAAAAGLLARLRDTAGLSPPELAVLQRTLGAAPSEASAGAEAAPAAILEALVATGCPVARMMAASRVMRGASGSDMDLEALPQDGESSAGQEVVRAAVLAVLRRCLKRLRGGVSTSTSEALQTLDKGVCRALEEARSGSGARSGAVGAAGALVGSLRHAVWDGLQAFVLERQEGAQGADASLGPAHTCALRLLASLARPSTGSGVMRWKGWQPEHCPDEHLQRMLLLARSQDVLGSRFPEVLMSMADLVDIQLAEALFMRLLQAASSAEQLLVLQRLLESAWCDLPGSAAGLAAGRDSTATAAADSSRAVESQPVAGAPDSNGTAGYGTGQHKEPAAAAGADHLQEDVGAAMNQAAAGENTPQAEGREALGAGASEAVAFDGWGDGDMPLEIAAGVDGTAGGTLEVQGAPDLAGTSTAAAKRRPFSTANEQLLQQVSDQADEAQQQERIVALHACWAALLARMLAGCGDDDGDSALVAVVLRTVESAAARPGFLLASVEALSVVAAARKAGDEAAAVALGLLMPYGEVQRAAKAALLRMAPPANARSGASLDALVAVLLSRRLWPQAAQAIAYPAFLHALLARPASSSGEAVSYFHTGGQSGGRRAGGWAALPPSAAASLAEGSRHADAAAVAARHAGLHPALATLGGSLALLRPYLLAHAGQEASDEPRPEAGTEQAAGCGSREDTSVPQAVARVWGMLSGQCERALARLHADTSA